MITGKARMQSIFEDERTVCSLLNTKDISTKKTRQGQSDFLAGWTINLLRQLLSLRRRSKRSNQKHHMPACPACNQVTSLPQVKHDNRAGKWTSDFWILRKPIQNQSKTILFPDLGGWVSSQWKTQSMVRSPTEQNRITLGQLWAGWKAKGWLTQCVSDTFTRWHHNSTVWNPQCYQAYGGTLTHIVSDSSFLSGNIKL